MKRNTKAAQPPAPPAYFNDDQKRAWSEMLEEVGELEDRTALETLEAYCVERDRWLEAEADIRANGAVLILRNDKGEAKQAITSPFLTVAKNAQERMLALSAKLTRPE